MVDSPTPVGKNTPHTSTNGKNRAGRFLNLSGYLFVQLAESELPALRTDLLATCRQLGVRGTILLSPEGINVMLCGLELDARAAATAIRKYPPLASIWLKESWSESVTFSRMLVKLKHEIIPVGDDSINPAERTGRYLNPESLRTWYDEGRDFVIIDTRNDYEVQIGSFENAIDLELSNFRTIASRLEALAKEDPSLLQRPVVTFCTGGVRCEKVTPIMMNMGFQDVYQLEGGIINYFERVGGDHYKGECFVFDKRVAVDANLEETSTTQCYLCQHVLTEHDQQLPTYVPGVSCPYCAIKTENSS